MGFRVLLFDRMGNPEGELSQDAGTLLSCTRSEEINSEHSLSLSTERHLEVGTRALTHHADGRWREWVVDEPGETHDTGIHAVGTYHLCWSIQYDLKTVYGNVKELGMVTAATPMQGVVAALDGTSRWTFGGSDVTTRATSVVMNTNESAWDRLTTVVKRWGGEIDAEITVNDSGVTSRKVLLKKHLGSTDAIRRFEWGHDLTSITRTPDPGPYACRLIPLGNGESEEAADGSTTYDVYLEITDVATFVDSSKGIRHVKGERYISDTQSEAAFRISNGKGGYEYPVIAVSYSTDDPDELVALAKEDILSHTRPGISYSGSVANFAEAGMDTDGIQLGDEVQIIDLGFNPDAPLRIQERVLSVEIDEMGIDDAKLNIGRLIPTLERSLATMAETLGPADISYNTPQWDPSQYSVPTPTLPVYEVQTPSSDGATYTAPTWDTSTTSLSDAIGDLESRVGAMESGAAYGGGSGSGSTTGHDSIIHQLNGVTFTTGTVNFTTAEGVSSDEGDDGQQTAEDLTTAAARWGMAVAGAVTGGGSKTGAATLWGAGGVL